MTNTTKKTEQNLIYERFLAEVNHAIDTAKGIRESVAAKILNSRSVHSMWSFDFGRIALGQRAQEFRNALNTIDIEDWHETLAVERAELLEDLQSGRFDPSGTERSITFDAAEREGVRLWCDILRTTVHQLDMEAITPVIVPDQMVTFDV